MEQSKKLAEILPIKSANSYYSWHDERYYNDIEVTRKEFIMKSYTDLEQSKKLAEILPIESADMNWHELPSIRLFVRAFPYKHDNGATNGIFPCWSLAALLELLDYPQLSKDKLGSGRVGWMVSNYPDNCRYDSCWHDNPVDCCYEIIIKLNELKML